MIILVAVKYKLLGKQSFNCNFTRNYTRSILQCVSFIIWLHRTHIWIDVGIFLVNRDYKVTCM